jgi:hypothetical protein
VLQWELQDDDDNDDDDDIVRTYLQHLRDQYGQLTTCNTVQLGERRRKLVSVTREKFLALSVEEAESLD